MAEGPSTILVVDDEPMVLGVVATALELAGYTVLKARDGAEALRVCQADNAGSILLYSITSRRE